MVTGHGNTNHGRKVLLAHGSHLTVGVLCRAGARSSWLSQFARISSFRSPAHSLTNLRALGSRPPEHRPLRRDRRAAPGMVSMKVGHGVILSSTGQKRNPKLRALVCGGVQQ